MLAARFCCCCLFAKPSSSPPPTLQLSLDTPFAVLLFVFLLPTLLKGKSNGKTTKRLKALSHLVARFMRPQEILLVVALFVPLSLSLFLVECGVHWLSFDCRGFALQLYSSVC